MPFPQLPENSASILIGPPLSGKTEFIYSYMMQALKNKQPVLFIATDKSPEDIKKDLVKSKIFYGQYANIMRFIDCYSYQAGNNLPDTEDTKRISSPIALNELSIAIAQSEVEFYKINPNHKVIFDSISTVLMFSNPQMVGRFLQVIIARIRNAGGSILLTLEEGMHDRKDIVTMEHLMSAIIYTKHEKDKIYIKADGIQGFEDWISLN
jgi:KaiC/GvpD/RAD55 family RecA-like ATPase